MPGEYRKPKTNEDGLRRSAFNSTPFGVASVLPPTGSLRRLVPPSDTQEVFLIVFPYRKDCLIYL
jgi:hypothetical protein